ncbi:MAG: SEC-C metal-binding domain-containing protein [Bacteroidales bacterium]
MEQTPNSPTTHHLGRNDPCHCGSGRKYKQCCLEKDEEAARARQAADEAATSSAATEPVTPPKPPKHQTHQPWKKSAANTHGFHPRVSTPRKVGGG